MDQTMQNIEQRWEQERRTRQLLDYLFDSMLNHVRAVPRDGPGELPPHDLVVVSSIDGDDKGDVRRALERNLGALADLLPSGARSPVAIVTRQDLLILLSALGPQSIATLGGWTTEALEERGRSTLEAWAHYRGREFDEGRG